jgi:hypothetical protein
MQKMTRMRSDDLQLYSEITERTVCYTLGIAECNSVVQWNSPSIK